MFFVTIMSLHPREQPEEDGAPDRARRLFHPLDSVQLAARPVSYPERQRSRLAQQPSNPRELPGLIRPADRSGFSQLFQQFHPAPTFPSESFRCPCQPPHSPRRPPTALFLYLDLFVKVLSPLASRSLHPALAVRHGVQTKYLKLFIFLAHNTINS